MSKTDARKEQRIPAMMRVRLRADGVPLEASINNLSARGLRMSATSAPQRGEIVEVTVAGQVLMGQVRWSNGNQFGVSLREQINVDALTLRLGGPIIVERRRPADPVPVAKAVLVDHLYVIAAGMGALAFLTYAVKVWL